MYVFQIVLLLLVWVLSCLTIYNLIVISQHLVWDTDATLTSFPNIIFKVKKNIDRKTHLRNTHVV